MSHFTENWFGPHSCEVLAALVRRVVNGPVPGRIIEIGAWEGRSTIAMANAAHPRQVHSVDTWQGSPSEISADLAAERDVFAQWKSNVAEQTAGNVVAHRMGWREYLPTLNHSVALCFIDAEHTYKEVRDNIAAILPHMSPGAILCGDDAHHEPVQRAVFEMLGTEHVYVAATLWVWEKPMIETVPTLTENFVRLCETPSDINEHLPRMAWMAETLKPQHIVELGARTGLSTTAWLYGLQGTTGRLTSVDLDPAPQIGVHANWRHIQGDDTDPAVMAQVDECDILFIDTSHHFEHTLWELRNWSTKVRPGGLIVCHDTELQRPWDPPCPPTDPDFPVKSAIELWCAETGNRWVNFPNCWGLGIIEVGG